MYVQFKSDCIHISRNDNKRKRPMISSSLCNPCSIVSAMPVERLAAGVGNMAEVTLGRHLGKTERKRCSYVASGERDRVGSLLYKQTNGAVREDAREVQMTVCAIYLLRAAIRLSAEPALNHSIWPWLKECASGILCKRKSSVSR
jgi:hypothetical protein